MKNTNNSFNVEYVSNKAWQFINILRKETSFLGSFNSVVSVLYGFHKGYYGNSVPFNHLDYPRFDLRYLGFIYTDDALLYDLEDSIPNDKVIYNMLPRFIQEFSYLNKESGKSGEGDFNCIYVDVLQKLFHLACLGGGRSFGDHNTPDEICKLMSYLIHKENCTSVYDPFCGTASIAKYLFEKDKSFVFEGQEVNASIAVYARLIVEGVTGKDDGIKLGDSVTQWNEKSFDAVVSFPPFGVGVVKDHRVDPVFFDSLSLCKGLDELTLSNAFSINKAKMSVTLQPVGFLYRGNEEKKKREYLIENNLLDTVISLPSNVLYNTGVKSCILVCKRNRHENAPVRYIHGENYFVGEGIHNRSFDYDGFVKMLEGDSCDCVEVSLDEIRQHDYNLEPSSLYYKQKLELKEGQKVVKIGELITLENGMRIPSKDVNCLVNRNLLSSHFISILLNDGKQETPTSKTSSLPCRKYEKSTNKYVLAFSSTGNIRYGINTTGNEFVVPSGVQVFKINEALVTPEYLAYILVDNTIVSTGRIPLSSYMNFPIVIDSMVRQREIVESEKQKYHQKMTEEKEAESKRLGVRQNTSDLEHMLSLTQSRIDNNISKLESSTPSSDDYKRIVKSLKDNVEYMKRVIKYNSSNLDSHSFNKKKGNIIEFIQNYADSWRNYGGECFELVVANEIDEMPVMSFDKAMITVMLDSILNNAFRHSFKKRKDYTEHNMVQIKLSIVERELKPFVLISVSNNGDPIAEGFTVDDYISKGRYSYSSGRSGLGGYHVYKIVKGHDGYLCLDSNKMWGVIVDVLLPVDSKISNMMQYEKECI